MKLQQSALALGLMLAMGLAQAAPVTLTGDTVDISFDDQGSYTGEVYSYYSGTLHYSSSIPSYELVGDALVLSPWELYANYGASGYADGGYVRFDLRDFGFTAHEGYAISGYRVSFTGTAGAEFDGSFTLDASSGSPVFAGDAFAFTANLTEWPAEGFSGWINLEAPYQSNEEGGADVFGIAWGSINTITVEAIAQPVPEPETYALMLAGFAGAAMASRRRRAARR